MMCNAQLISTNCIKALGDQICYLLKKEHLNDGSYDARLHR